MSISPEFRLPIEYNNKHKTIDAETVENLEFIKPINNATPLYHAVFDYQGGDPLTDKIISKLAKTYTTDTLFLKDTKKMIHSLQLETTPTTTVTAQHETTELWGELKELNHTDFADLYKYINLSPINAVNKNSLCMSAYMGYNLFSPLITICMPIIVLILPFFILKLQGIELTIAEYINTLKALPYSSFFTNCATLATTTTPHEKIYVIATIVFYMFSIYQNIKMVIDMFANIKHMILCFDTMGVYIDSTISNLSSFLEIIKNLQSKAYTEFSKTVTHHINVLDSMKQKITKLSTTFSTWTNIFHLGHLGQLFSTFYELHEDQTFYNSLYYSFEANEYVDLMYRLASNKCMKFADFKKNPTGRMVNFYHGHLKGSRDVVTNTMECTPQGNIIITGPNASGKTTLIKSCLTNAILTQQFGCGFYEKCNIPMFGFFSCYLNIPETNDRDSLFQAEARRCKTILDIVEKHPKQLHFCVFDELFSGTNPSEAEKSSIAFVKYISKKPNVFFILTTHFTNICNSFDNHVKNYMMNTTLEKNEVINTYRAIPGISTVRTAIHILHTLKYPKDLLDLL